MRRAAASVMVAIGLMMLGAVPACDSGTAGTGDGVGSDSGDEVGDDTSVDDTGDTPTSGDDTGTDDTASDDTSGETCTATFRWLQKDAYADLAGRSSPLWPPHTTTTLQVICVDELGTEALVGDAFMANHGTEPGTLDLHGDVVLVETNVESVQGSRAELLSLVDTYQGCECFPGTNFLSMDALEDEAVQAVVQKLLEYVGANLDCGGNPPVSDVITALQAGDIETVLEALPGCTWADGHDWGTGFSEAAAVLLDDIVTTLDGYHVCNNDALLQATLWAEYLETGAIGTCDSGSAMCAGPMWFYEPAAAGDGGDETGELPPCETEIDELSQPDVDVLFDCALPSPCADVSLNTSGSETGGGDPDTFTDEAAVACVVSAFKAGEPAQVVLDHATYISDWTETVFILDATHAVAHGSWWYDSPGGTWRKERQLLQSPEYFDGCLAEADASVVFECLKGWSAGCGDVAMSCE